MRLLPLLLLPLLLSCVHRGLPPPEQDEFIEAVREGKGYIRPPTPHRFSICQDYTCNTVRHLSLTDEEWQGVRRLLLPPADRAGAERDRIAQAVAAMERLVGPKSSTEHDLGGTFAGVGHSGQMDCVDEATNTTAYLNMFLADGLLRHHVVETPAWRGYFLLHGWPHTSAVIRETATGALFVVDSWFHGNGVPPEILPLEEWQQGWEPPSSR